MRQQIALRGQVATRCRRTQQRVDLFWRHRRAQRLCRLRGCATGDLRRALLQPLGAGKRLHRSVEQVA
ncbi:hypothetical protein JH307_01030 [Xanthomonas campestris]|nr:hypothetical protein JH307_01030 [Xanthomonas campestris]